MPDVFTIIYQYAILNTMKPRDIDRFWSKVDKTAANGCWEWTAAKHKDGYGIFWVDNTVFLSHRISAKYFANLNIDNLCICHSCDNPSCVNPQHLFAGTQADNVKDMDNKGRRHNRKGINNGRAKLSENDIKDIQTKQLSYKEYMKKYNISNKTVYNIWNNITWTHI